NSPLRSSGYTYFLYDGRTGTEEFAPLGYWDGKKYKDIKFIDIPNNRKETDATIAYNNTGIVLGTVNKKFKGMAGWYYINPTSKWNLYINPDVQSGKTLNGVQFGNEVSYKDYIITNNDLGEELGVSFGGTNKTFKPSSDSPVKFYIDTDGYLRCLYYVNTKVSDNGYKGYDVSYVYQNNDQDYIKVEALQRALGSFVTELEAQFPASMVSAVRFSTKEVVEGSDNVDKALDMLVLGDWTADAREAQKILSNQRGQTTLNGVPLFGTILGSSSTGSPFADVVGNGIEQYNYGLTGNTSTRTGLRSFYENLATRLETFKDKSGTSGKKYLIVFTDGKDTDLEDTKQDPAVANLEAYTWANKLKEEGYTIYCVMLSGGPVKKGRADYDNAIRFLKRLSGPGKGHEGYGTYQFKDDAESKDDDYVYSTEDYIDDDNINASASGGSVDALINIFKGETGILKHIANDLKDYNVQDYIDPRFDLVDDDNNVWHLNTKGQIVLTDKEGKPVIGENGKPVQYTLSDKKNVTQEITLFDSKNLRDTHLKNKLTEKSSKAVLHYDDGKDMYYLVWTGQTIPGSYVGASKLRTWHSKITVRAKDDFIGGNAVLSNGNGKGENYVYYPSDKTASSGITESTRNKDKYPSKGFPRTTVNIQPRETEDEVKIPIYLDDVLENQSGIMSDFIDSDTDSAEYYYWEYLARYVKYYNDLVDAGEEPPELPTKIAEDGSTSRVKPRSDGKLYLEDLFKAISGGKLKVPYSYLSNTDETNQTGGKEHRADVLGYLTYSIDDYKNGDGEEHKQYPTNPDTAKDLTPRGLEASVTFTPLPPDDRIEKNDELVTEKDKDGDHIYRWDVDYKEVVGDDVEEEELVVDHETTIVSGEIALFVVMSDEDVAALKSIGVKTVTYTADLYRGSVKVGTYTHTVNIGSGDHQIVKSEISYVSSEFDYAKNGLPHGVYTLSNCQAKFIGGSYKTTPYIFDSPGVVDDGEEYTDDVFDLDIHGSDNPGGFIAKLGDTQIELGAGYETQDGEQDRLDSCYGIFIVEGSPVGDLKLTKTVKGSSDQKALFTFNVVLNMPEDMGNSVSFGGYTFKKESGTTYSTTVMLANGESVLFRSLPVGTKYKIDEINIPEGYKLETIKNASGEILVGDVAEAEGINKSLDLSQLLVTKRVVGITESPKNNEAFTFKVKIDGREDDITAKIYKYNGETWEDTGETTTLRFTNNITQFTLKDGEGLLLTDIDNGSDYTVTEVLETGAAFTFGRVSDRNGNSMNVTEDGNAKTYTVTGVTSKDELEEVHYFNLPRNFDLPKAGGKEVFMASLLFAGLFVSLLGLIFIFFALKKRRSM
ncbi:MAG: hypothetical protein J1E96_04475, partial [Ruminococcus sp.]|nr:hypothetical protein [Ruminococcus sp.]